MTKYGTDFVVGAIVAVGGGRIDISMCVSVCVCDQYQSLEKTWKAKRTTLIVQHIKIMIGFLLLLLL